MKHIKNCLICQKEFATRYIKASFCSKRCGALNRSKPLKTCLICNENFKHEVVKKNQYKKYCSRKCYGISQPAIRNLKNFSNEQHLERLKKSFNKRVVKKDGCWEFKGSLCNGYGSLSYKGKKISLHRASWILHNGEVPIGLLVCHTCDNRSCSNPDHLFIGTVQDNSDDMINKGRNVILKGEKHGGSKLKESEVIKIRELIKQNISTFEISKKYNISKVTVRDVKNKKTWKHIQDSQ